MIINPEKHFLAVQKRLRKRYQLITIITHYIDLDGVHMKPLTKLQTIELVLIPIVFVFSQILVLFFGKAIVGDDACSI